MDVPYNSWCAIHPSPEKIKEGSRQHNRHGVHHYDMHH